MKANGNPPKYGILKQISGRKNVVELLTGENRRPQLYSQAEGVEVAKY